MTTWRAQWIWDGGEAAPVNAYRIFRKTFTLPEDATEEQMTARICADTRYKLHVNGCSITHGPAPATPGHYAYDEVDLEYALQKGKENVITIIVNYIGAPTFSYYRYRGGLLFEMGNVVSDETWLVAKHSPWQADAPRLTVQQGFCEYYDAEKDPVGLFYSDINSDEWEQAVIICPAEGGEWKTLKPRDIPEPERTYQEPLWLLEYGNCTPGEADTVAGQMTGETLRPLTRGQITRELDTAPIKLTPDGEDFYLLYDFGEEVSGFLDFDIEAEDGAAGGFVDIGYDETLRVGETPSGLKHDWGANSNLRYADRLILRDGDQNFQNYGHRAFRYVRLAFRNLKAPVTLAIIGVYESTYPVNYKGVFACSDARLNKIWEIGRRTLQLCMDDRFMDCPWRERAQWVGDAKVEALGAQYCFGDTLLLKRMLRTQARTQYADGKMDPVGPGEWDDHQVDQPIPGFVCIWIHTVGDYYLLTGDKALPQEVFPIVERALAWLGSHADARGLLGKVHGWNFVDWAPGLSGGGERGLHAPLNLQYLQALRVAAFVAREIGNGEKAAQYEAMTVQIAASFDAVFWDEARGFYKDLIVEDEAVEDTFSQQTNSLALLYEVGSRDKRNRILGTLLTDEKLTPVGSPYFSFYLLAALYREGRHNDALAYIRQNWGRMLDAGATSWWEEYHGQTSLCHAWSCGPTIDLQAEVLGVSAGAPGFDVVRVAPHPCDLTWAKGIVPIPQGDVVVNWRKTDERGGFLLNITCPRDVQVQPVLPSVPTGAVVTLNGERQDGELGALPGGGYQICVTPA